ncbi:MAG: leucine-rich repeat protein [Oscillospiraceae bacterium]|nr:leucine-rich repeat protein [Oscillospiraceae bacterium]
MMIKIRINKQTAIKIFAVAAAFATLTAVIRFTAFGNRYAVSDSDYLFTVNGSEATITGCNAELSGAVMLPASLQGYTVTAIGDGAFKGFDEVTCFFLPASVTSIGSYAFEGCTSLLNASFPGALTKISEGAYWGCSSLVSVTIPENVVSIGSCAFYGCGSLESVIVLGRSTKAAGIFNVQLDVGEVLAMGFGVFKDPRDNSLPTVYCYDGSQAMYDLLKCQFSRYALLDGCTLTSYTVNYVDGLGSPLYPSKTFPIQPAGINILEVAARIDGYTVSSSDPTGKLLVQNSAANTVNFIYEEYAESTTDVTEPTTVQPGGVSLIPMASSTTVIDYGKKFIYGLKLVVTESDLRNIFLDVDGDGYFVVQPGTLGTGAKVTLYSNYDPNFEEVYKLVIFGDVTGDGLVTASDVSEIKRFIADNESVPNLDNRSSPFFFAADLYQNGVVNQSVASIVNQIALGARGIDQRTGLLI